MTYYHITSDSTAYFLMKMAVLLLAILLWFVITASPVV